MDLPKPPVAASNHPADQESGVAREITPEELAVADAARKGDPGTADARATEVQDEKPEDKKRAAKKVDADDPDIADLPANSPDWYRREVASIRRTERAKTEAAFAAAKAQVGEDAWNAALEATRDKVVGEAKAEAARALKDAKEARDAIAAREAEIAELKARVPVVEEKVVEDPRPTRDHFDDPDEYDDALTAWGEREGERKAAAREAAATAEATRAAEEAANQEAFDRQQALIKETKDRFDLRVEEAKTRYDDFEEVVKRPADQGGPTVTDAMTASVLMAENGPDVAYHLGMNIDEARRIAELPTPAHQIFAMGQLANQIQNPPRRARPPAPIVPIDTTRNSGDTDREPTMEEYAAKRMAQLRQDRKPFFPPGLH